MSKMNRPMRRCLLDVHGMRGVTCGALMYADDMADHCIHMHGTAEGKWTEFIKDAPCEYNQGGRERCDCGNFKSFDLKICIECSRASQVKRKRQLRDAMEPEEIKDRRNAVKKALRVALKERGICARCAKAPAVRFFVECQGCRDGTTKRGPIGRPRSSPTLPLEASHDAPGE